jgi:predicted ribosome quality control (RQC) complex YloA/Tae2 family protein
MITEQEKGLSETESKAELSRRIGNLIYAHISELQALFDKFQAGKQTGKALKTIAASLEAEKQKGLGSAKFFESLDSKCLMVTVRIEELTFNLDIRRTLYENAAWFYDQGKRDKQRLYGVQGALADSRKKLTDVEAKIRDAEAVRRVKPAEAIKGLERQKVKQKKWFEKFRWFISSDGFLVVAGRDAVTNEVLVKKYTDEHDIVFHADIVGAPFVVIKSGDKNPSVQCLNEAGEFAAAFSRGWREGFGSVDVYWVRPGQLTKAGPSGQSVGHGAFVVHGERNWMRGIELKLAIGIVTDESGLPKFVGGPVSAVKVRSEAYVVVKPGDSTGKELFRLALKTLVSKVSQEMREKLVLASTEEIREYIPYGKGTMIEN